MTDIFKQSLENITRFEEAKKENGSVMATTRIVKTTTVANNGGNNLKTNQDVKTEVALTQQAYIDGPADSEGYFKASAVDADGQEYEVNWDIKEGMEDAEDMQEMCDWESPTIAEEI